MQVDGVEGFHTGELDAEHHHARHPEEEDVCAGFHHRGGIEVLQVGGLLRPAERGEWPQSGGEPGVEHVFILAQVVAAALGAFGRVFARHNGLAAVIAVPHRDAVPPPQLPADAPVADVLQPVIKDFGKVFRHDLGAPGAHRFQRFLRQRLDRARTTVC